MLCISAVPAICDPVKPAIEESQTPATTAPDTVDQTSDQASNDQTQPADFDDQTAIKEEAVAKRRAQLTREALSCRGSRYVWGGDGRGGTFDCSGFTQFLYAKKGIKLPHSAKAQFGGGTSVSKAELKEGDLVFFNTRGPITHVGMYISGGKFIHAANRRRGVVVDSIDEPYYAKRYAGARRYTDSTD
jgi:cell wall-associated NlpC family hydrolase